MRLDRAERLEQIKTREKADADKEIHCRYETEDHYVAQLLNQARFSIGYLLRYGGSISENGSSLSEPQLDQLEAVYMCLHQISRMIRKWRPYGYRDSTDYFERQWRYSVFFNDVNDGRWRDSIFFNDEDD